jgi:hypothetical protein
MLKLRKPEIGKMSGEASTELTMRALDGTGMDLEATCMPTRTIPPLSLV